MVKPHIILGLMLQIREVVTSQFGVTISKCGSSWLKALYERALFKNFKVYRKTPV